MTKCWFCQQNMKTGSEWFCTTRLCHSFQVTYTWDWAASDGPRIDTARLVGTLWNGKLDSEPRKFFVTYLMSTMKMSIIEEIDVEHIVDNTLIVKHDWKIVGRLDFTKPIITPENFTTKLSTIITFS